jgi:hypothetical protein
MSSAERQRRYLDRLRNTATPDVTKLRAEMAALKAENTALKAENAALRGAGKRKRDDTLPKSDDEQINRLRALWKSGRDKFYSFFRVLQDVHQEIGDKAMQEWCSTNLRISLGVMENASGALPEDDQIRANVQADLRKWRNAARARR